MTARTAPVRRVLAVALALLLAMTGAVAAAGPAVAIDGGLTFDEGYAADGARVDDQYRFVGNGGTSGIRFGGTRVDLGWPGETECGGNGTGDFRPTLRLLTGNGTFSFYAHSGARVLESSSTNCSAGEFGTGGVLFRCTIQCLSVSGFVGLGNGTSTPPSPPTGMAFTASAYDAAGAPVVSTSVPLDGPGALTGFSLTAPGGSAITFVKIVASGAVQSVLLDDLAYTVDPAALPAYVVSTGSAGAVVRPGESTSVALTVVRSNGSTGTISPSVTGLPAGVTASFGPASFLGTADGPFTMTLTASPSADVGGPIDLAVAATSDPGAGVGTGVAVPLTVASTLAPLGGIPTLLAPSCTTQVRELPVFVGDGSSFTGSVDVSASIDQPGWSAGVVTTPLAVTNGRVDPAVYWTKDGLLGPFSAHLTVTASPQGRPNDSVSRTYSIAYQPAGFAATSVKARPPLGDHQPAEALALAGQGFCGTLKLKFGNDKAVVDATATQGPIATLPRNGVLNLQTVTATTPRLATSGTLGFDRVDTFGWKPGPALTTTGYRNTAGFAFTNYPVTDLTYQDMTDAFGADQTYSHLDLCFPLGCTITFRDPVAMIYTAIVRAQTVGTEGSGHCYGMAMTAALLRSGGLDPTAYLPYSSPTAFGLNGASGPAAALARTVQANHLKQFGMTFLSYWLKQHGANVLNSGNDTVTQVRRAIDTQGGAMVTIADHGGGHVVLAHSVEDVSPTEHWIDVYDPNWEYTAAEDSDTSGAEHEKRLTSSRIHIVGSSWSLEFPDGTVWTGKVNGLASSLVVVPLSEASKKQLLPSLLGIQQIVGLLGSLLSFGSTGGTTTVSGGPGLLRYAAMNASTTSGLFLPAPTDAEAPQADSTVHLAGTGTGTVDGLVLADGTLVTSALGMRAGTDVTVQKVRGGQAISTDATLPTTVTTIRAGTTQLTSTVSYVAPAASTVSVAQVSGGLVVRSSAPVSLRLRIDNRTARSVGVTRTMVLALPARTSLVVPTASLRSAATVVPVTLGGHRVLVRAPRVLAGSAAVRAVATARARSTLLVAANVAVKAKPGARGTVVLVLMRGSRVVASKRFVVTARAAARGTTVAYRWRVVAPRGLTLRVVAVVAPTTTPTGAVTVAKAVLAR